MNSTQLIKRELYLRVRAEVEDHLGPKDSEVRKLKQAMERLTRGSWRRLAQKDFDRQVHQAQVVFWGDFHGVRQYQRSLVRTLDRLGVGSMAHFCLGLECIPIEHQKSVDLFLQHEISEEEFLKLVKWEQIWGFPWEHYRPLFLAAKTLGFPILALNENSKRATTEIREKKAFRILQNYLKKYPEARVWVLFGEYHLLPQHFPKLWRTQPQKNLFVLQNSDSLYFQFPPKRELSGTFYLSNGGSYLCLQSVAPWIKWQSYLLFLEAQMELEMDEELEISDHVVRVAKTLAEEMNWKFQPQWVQAYRTDDHALWQKMKESQGGHRRLFEKLLQEEFSFMSFHGGWSHLSRLSVNEVGSLAFLILWFQNHPKLTWPGRRQYRLQEWQHLIWIFGFSYFGSKLLNPHRRTPSLQELQAQARLAGHPFERQAARLVIHSLLQTQTGRVDNVFDSTPSDRVRFLALTWLAGLFGERIFAAYQAKRLSLSTLKTFLSKDPAQAHFSEVWQNLEETLLF